MSTNTSNYGFVKPDQADFYDIDIQNSNMDLLDAALSPTADQAVVPTQNTGKLSSWVSWIANRIKEITGKADWKTAPRTTLENAVKRDGDTMSGSLRFETLWINVLGLVLGSTSTLKIITGVQPNDSTNQRHVKIRGGRNNYVEINVSFQASTTAFTLISYECKGIVNPSITLAVENGVVVIYISTATDFSFGMVNVGILTRGNGALLTTGWNALSNVALDPSATLVTDITANRVYNDIVEKGSNANGEYIRFADGTQICSMKNNVNFSLTTFQNFTFPANFIAFPAMSHSAGAVLNASDYTPMGASWVESRSTTGYSFKCPGGGTAETRLINFLAIGRWK